MSEIDWFDKAEKATLFLEETDRQVAMLKQKHEIDKRKAKRIWSAIYMRVEGSIEARKAQAETHADYQSAQAAEMTSLGEYEALRNRRDTAQIVMDFWRSYNRATREGIV